MSTTKQQTTTSAVIGTEQKQPGTKRRLNSKLAKSTEREEDLSTAPSSRPVSSPSSSSNNTKPVSSRPKSTASSSDGVVAESSSLPTKNHNPVTNKKSSTPATNTNHQQVFNLIHKQHDEIVLQINNAMNAYNTSMTAMKTQFLEMLNTVHQSNEEFRKSMIAMEKERMKLMENIVTIDNTKQVTTSVQQPTKVENKITNNPQQTTDKKTIRSSTTPPPTVVNSGHVSNNASVKSSSPQPSTTSSPAKQNQTQPAKEKTNVSNNTTQQSKTPTKKEAVVQKATVTSTTNTTTNSTKSSTPTTKSETSKTTDETLQTRELTISRDDTFFSRPLKVIYLSGENKKAFNHANKILSKLPISNAVYGLNILWNAKEEKRVEDSDAINVEMRYIVLCNSDTVYVYKVATQAERKENNIAHSLPSRLYRALISNTCLKFGWDTLEKVNFLYHNLDNIYVTHVSDLSSFTPNKSNNTIAQLLSQEYNVPVRKIANELRLRDNIDYSKVLTDEQLQTEAKRCWVEYNVLERKFKTCDETPTFLEYAEKTLKIED